MASQEGLLRGPLRWAVADRGAQGCREGHLPALRVPEEDQPGAQQRHQHLGHGGELERWRLRAVRLLHHRHGEHLLGACLQSGARLLLRDRAQETGSWEEARWAWSWRARS